VQDRSELHIVVPGICGPLAETQSLQHSHVLNKWINILSKSQEVSSTDSVNDVIASILNLTIEDDFPSAALTLLANDPYDESKHYMFADPVHLQADMDHAILTSSEDLNINAEEAALLCDSLNRHFNQDGLDFIVLQNKQWLVSTTDKIQLNTTPLVEAVGRNVNFILPEGEGATHWKKILTEAQMLMHLHEVNTAREKESKLSINSLWFHGSGNLPASHKHVAGKENVSSICSNQAMLNGLANHVKCNYIMLPESTSEYIEYLLANTNNSVNVLHLSDLEHLVNYTDVDPWLGRLTALLEHWIYPLLKVANNKNIKVTLYPCNKKQYHFSKYDFLKFWRQAKLEQYVNSY